ncbi:MAG TPA: RNA polymerase recycling motor ATPase HelR [Pseudonocardia sp.]|nr:RNA polymerase recycling motor ATPase HelR [Pseudonocardia sp.]
MSSQGYDGELLSERSYVAGLYERLDAERARVQAQYESALGGTGGSPMERDVQVRASAKQVKRLHVADSGLCFGRLDSLSGERSYIGRIGIFDEDDDYAPLLLDWRAPASRPFYTATGANPENMRRRRQFHTRGRRIVEFTDEMFGRPGGADLGGADLGDAPGDAALLAAVNAPRGEGMRDIVMTIQAEQDEIIRLDHPGVLVIEGGPGTGKTVVALHRVAYLLYTQRERIERNGVLVVGPNPAFLNHIGRVLPSLGESDVVFVTTGDLVPGLRVDTEDTPEAARLKGSLAILEVLKAAVSSRQRLPEDPLPITLAGVELQIDGEICEWARDEARASGRPHNEARAVFVEIITYVLTERAINRIGRGWVTREDKKEWERLRAELLRELGANDRFTAVIDELWPILTPETLLGPLYESAELLRAAGADRALARTDGTAWTVSDVPLLDELVDLLGRDRAAEQVAQRAAERERKAQAEYAEAALDMLTNRQDSMDDEDHLYATDLLYASELADRFVEHDTRELVERASADRDWTYRHVVVDEAQELSAMDWRVLMRRCPSRSFTVVGDLAQRRSEAGAGAGDTSWATMLDPYVPGRWEYRSLTVNYRTPAEIMSVAAAVLAEFAPGVKPPESVRACGVRPWSRRVGDDGMAAAVEEFVRDEAGREGTCVVIGPPHRGPGRPPGGGSSTVPGAVAPHATKGLEFDSVLVVDPDLILADGPRGAAELYVALTRATQRLGVLHRGPLPAVLSGLAEVVPAEG